MSGWFITTASLVVVVGLITVVLISLHVSRSSQWPKLVSVADLLGRGAVSTDGRRTVGGTILLTSR